MKNLFLKVFEHSNCFVMSVSLGVLAQPFWTSYVIALWFPSPPPPNPDVAIVMVLRGESVVVRLFSPKRMRMSSL